MKRSISNTNNPFPNPVFIVGTYDVAGVPNAINVACGGVASGNPSRLSISVRPERYSHGSLMLRKAFTVNLPSAEYVDAADYFGISSGRYHNKFEETGLTPVKGDFVDAPYIKEFPINLECIVKNIIDLGQYTLFIGEVLDIKVNNDLAKDNINIWDAEGILTFDSMNRVYRKPGEVVGSAFSCGQKYKRVRNIFE